MIIDNIKIMTQEEFKKGYEELKPHLVGFGRVVANEADVPYYTYRNALSGQISNSGVLERIYQAMLLVVKNRAEALIDLAEKSMK